MPQNYRLDGTKILSEKWGNNTLIPLYSNEDEVCGIIYNGTAYYFLKNLQGDVISIKDAHNRSAYEYLYDAWGVCKVVSDDTEEKIAYINPFRYRSYYDAEIKMYYLQSRYYVPDVGRFLNSDDVLKLSAIGIVFDYNYFIYCKNNPICNKDVHGYFGTPIQWVFAAVGVVAGWFLGDYILTYIYLDDDKIRSVSTHEYYIVGKGWVKASEILSEDKLYIPGTCT